MQELLEEIRGLSSTADDILDELEDVNSNLEDINSNDVFQSLYKTYSGDILSELKDINRKSDNITSGIQDLKGR